MGTIPTAAIIDDPAVAPEITPEPRAMRIVRRAIEAPLGALVAGNIEGIDPLATDDTPEDERNGAPWYEIASFEDLDRAMADTGAHRIHKLLLIERLQRDLAALDARQKALLLKYQHLVPGPEQGKAYKQTRGNESGGNYRNQPERLPEIKLTDKQAALAAGYGRIVESIAANTEAVRDSELTRDQLAKLGVELIPQPAVSYTAPKLDKGDA